METVSEIRERILTWQSERQELLEIRDLLNAQLDGEAPTRRRKKGKVGRPKGSKNAVKVPKNAATGGFEFVPPLASATTGIAKGRKGVKGRAVARPESALD